jgi:lipoate-protein ligase A
MVRGRHSFDGANAQGRLLVTPPADGSWNMALDEALLQQAAAEGRWALRFYAWREPTLSLGYFQAWQARQLHPESLDCACVRRSSGGGAILHDLELTYSLAVPPGHRLARSAESGYQAVHRSLVSLLREQFGIDASLAEKSTAISQEEPFLCFERRAGGDIVTGDFKVAGSAQRRWQGAVLQHGSILLRRSRCASQLPGLENLSGRGMAWDQLARCWQTRLADSLGVRLIETEPSADDLRLADEIACSRYSQVAWTRRR